MLMWLLTLAGIFICYFISEKKKNPRKFFLISAGIVIVLILGSRHFINGFTDEITYNYLYQGYSKLSFGEFLNLQWGERDFGFYLTYWCMAHIIPWAQFPIYFITALFVGVTFRFIYKNTNATLIPVLLMFSFGTFSFYMAAYRQCFAMCVCLIAFEFAKKRGWRGLLPYAALMFLAATMHISSVIFIPVYFLLRIKENGAGFAIWAAALIAIILTANTLMVYAAEILESDGYLDTLEFSATGLVIQMFIMLVPFAFSLVKITNMGNLSRLQHSLLILTSVGMMFLGFKFMYYTYERVSYYYSIFAIGSFSNAVTNITHKKGEKNFVLPLQIVIIGLLAVLALWRTTSNINFFWQV